MESKAAALQAILDRAIDGKKIFGTSFSLKYKGEIWQGASGNLQPESPFFIASTTKLFTSAILFHLQSTGKINLEDPISRYLDSALMDGLHVLRGQSHAEKISVRHLLAHTSGLPDYFQQKNASGSSLEDELMRGYDQNWTLEEALARSKQMGALFIPGTPGKANYSDTNFQLLGRIIEQITGKPIEESYRSLIIEPLKLSNTYLYRDADDKVPHTFYYKNKPLSIPKAMTSFGPDGGMVSTSAELLRFLEAFFNGELFPATYIPGLQSWNPIFAPLKAGVGIQRFKLPRIFDPLGVIPELIGHSGLSGTLAYCNLEKDIYIAGTVNQVANPDLSFRLTIKLVREMMKK